MKEFENALQVASEPEWDAWLTEHSQGERQVWVVIFKKASKKQTVTFDDLLETALCHGWVDVQTKSVDNERYGIRFCARRPGSNWSSTNRAIVKQLIDAGRMHEAGKAVLPPDL